VIQCMEHFLMARVLPYNFGGRGLLALGNF
jgi:hypothetical protein